MIYAIRLPPPGRTTNKRGVQSWEDFHAVVPQDGATANGEDAAFVPREYGLRRERAQADDELSALEVVC
jgi:hypothetical protein